MVVVVVVMVAVAVETSLHTRLLLPIPWTLMSHVSHHGFWLRLLMSPLSFPQILMALTNHDSIYDFWLWRLSMSKTRLPLFPPIPMKLMSSV